MKFAKLIIFGLFVVALLGSQANAQGFRLFGKPKQDRVQSLELTQRAGPWLIMCMSFSGEDGHSQAQRLANELRTRYRLPAYIYSHHFDHSKEVANMGRGWEVANVGNRKLLRQIRVKAQTEGTNEIAVLVGDFPSVDDSKAQRTLTQIKSLRPETLGGLDQEQAANDQSLAGSRWRALTNRINNKPPEKKQVGPMGAAFMIPNPTLPEEYFRAKKVDSSIVKWNKKREHSLLKNDGIYTVKIATFKGENAFTDRGFDSLKLKEEAWRKKHNQAKAKGKLEKAEFRAEILAKYLRSKGVEAYQFHDRQESAVYVGSFDWHETTDARGVKRVHPGIEQTIQQFQANRMANGAYKSPIELPPKYVRAGIKCDIQPEAVLVPKMPASRVANAFGRNVK